METERFEDLSLTDKIDIFVQVISGHEKESKIEKMIAIFTALNMSLNTAIRGNFTGYTTEEVIELLPKLMIGDYNEEERAWEAILETLNPEIIWDIIDNIDGYTKKYNEIDNLIEDMKLKLLKLFVELNQIKGGLKNEKNQNQRL